MKTESLIAELARNATPVRRLAPPSRRVAPWLLLALPLSLAAAAFLGFRSHMEGMLVVQVTAALATGLVAAWAALASTIPGYPLWPQALPVLPGVVWVGLVGRDCLVEWAASSPAAMVTKVADTICLPEVVALGLLPAIVLITMARRGAPLYPARTAALAVLAATAIGSAMLTLAHEEDAAITELVWHVGTVALMSGLAALAGNRLFRRPARLP